MKDQSRDGHKDGGGENDSSAVSFRLWFAHTICHAWVYTVRGSWNGRLVIFVFLFFDVFTLCPCDFVCSYRQDTCIIVCVYCGASCSTLLKRSEAGSWPKLKGMTVTFGQNQEQSVFCLYCFIHSSSLSVLAAVLSLSYSISFFPRNCTTEKKNGGMDAFSLHFFPFFLLCALEPPSIGKQQLYTLYSLWFTQT